MAQNDIGAIFNDPSLNDKFIDKESGLPTPCYTYKEERGCIYIRCNICNLQVIGKRNLDTHLEGKKHRNKAGSVVMASKILFRISLIILFSYDPFQFPGKDLLPPGEEPAAPLLPTEPVIFQILDKFKEAPLIGLEYVVEIIHGPSVDPSYECLLCNTRFDSSGVVSDVVSASHRLKYLVSLH